MISIGTYGWYLCPIKNQDLGCWFSRSRFSIVEKLTHYNLSTSVLYSVYWMKKKYQLNFADFISCVFDSPNSKIVKNMMSPRFYPHRIKDYSITVYFKYFSVEIQKG